MELSRQSIKSHIHYNINLLNSLAINQLVKYFLRSSFGEIETLVQVHLSL